MLAVVVSAIAIFSSSGDSPDRNAPVAGGKAAGPIETLFKACKGHFDGPGQTCTTVPRETLLKLCNSWLNDELTAVVDADLDAPTTSTGEPVDAGLGPATNVGRLDPQGRFAITCSHHDTAEFGWGVTLGLPSPKMPLSYSDALCPSTGPTTTCQKTSAGDVSHLHDSQIFGDEFEVHSPHARISAHVRNSTGNQGAVAAKLLTAVLDSIGIPADVTDDRAPTESAPTENAPSPSDPVTGRPTSEADTPSPTPLTGPITPSSASCPTATDIRAAAAADETDPSVPISGGKVLACAGGWAGVTVDEYGNSVGLVLHKNAASKWVIADKAFACGNPDVPQSAIEAVCTAG